MKILGKAVQVALKQVIFSKEHTREDGVIVYAPKWYVSLVNTKGFAWVDEAKVSLDEWSYYKSKGE
jgi:hypothetical protein